VIIFQKAPAANEPSPPQRPATEVAAPPPLRDVAEFTAPIDIPTVLPDIDLRRSVTDPQAFAIRPPRGSGDEGAPVVGAALQPDAVLTAMEVEQPVRVSGQPVAPAYPDALQRAGVEGEVLVTFVVDTLGLADLSTLAVIRSTHDLFTQAVRKAIGQQRFTPAIVGSRTVRQLVQQPYSFTIRR
jgi:protein TonB